MKKFIGTFHWIISYESGLIRKMSVPGQGENVAAGILLHELQNINPNGVFDEEEFEEEQRRMMPDAAFAREEVEENETVVQNQDISADNHNKENEPTDKLSCKNLVYEQPEPIRRTLNDRRERFGGTIYCKTK